MKRYYGTPVTVEKEHLATLKFPAADVLSEKSDISKRAADIERAMLLGNNYKGKVKILFHDREGLKQVETTIWGFTDKRVLLKKDLVIPIHCIREIKV